MIIRVPANLLLLGEYVITMPGGLGVAFAIERFVTIEIQKTSSLQIESADDAFIHFILEELGCRTPLKISVDSSELYTLDGRKKGYGSSAAIIAGLTYAYLKITQEEEPDLLESVFPLAHKIHRKYQGGRGSGYDIMASLFGGVGLFTGGNRPRWEPIEFPWKKEFTLIQGEEPVSTKEALFQFEKLPDQARYFTESNNIVTHFIKSPSLNIIDQAAHLNHSLHNALGISCKIPYKGRGKPLGAGGEVAAVFEDVPHSKHEKVTISEKGIQCY